MAHKLTLSVSQLNEYVRRMIQLDPVLHGISIRGEISNLKFHQTGTLFFTLKDEEAAINCVMYPQAAAQLQAAPFDGMKATIYGSVGLYTKSGQYQFYADTLQVQGVGVLYEKLMALKMRLAAEGIFDQAHKQPLPSYVNTIGVVTSSTGAVIHDIISVSLRRDPDTRILLCPVRVQGLGAAQEVVRAVRLLDQLPDVSVIIVARGGGSIEDLWTFNEEDVVRTVADCKTPIVSAVGHETDVTLCDLAADFRAPTPSAAAECVVAAKKERLDAIDSARKQLRETALKYIKNAQGELGFMKERLSSMHPKHILKAEEERLSLLRERLRAAAAQRIQSEMQRVEQGRRELSLLSPYQVLSRGYSIVMLGDRVVASGGDVSAGDVVRIRLRDGTIRASVLDEGK